LSEEIHPDRKTVLVVEDDLSTRQLLTALMRRSGLEVIAVATGSEAISLLGQRPVDLTILDLMMPVTSGYDVLAFLESQNPRRPVIICTAAGPHSTEQIDSSLIRAIVRKPFDIDALATLVAEVLREDQ
jgi:CheY-like chemotaxis protein